MYSYELSGHNGDTSSVSMFNSSKQYWSSGDWGGQYFSNIPESVGQKWLSLQFTSNKEEQYVQYAIEDPTVLSRGIMDVSGQMKVLLWFEGSSQDWQAVYTVPKSQCDVHATCGPFTVCSDVPSPSCSCMKGYSIWSPQDWELGDRSAGCARNTPLYCNSNSSGVGGETDKFYPMTSVQLPVSELQKTTTFGASSAENHQVANHLQKSPRIQ
uniref:S-locus glycoprotein domain-containing protein n=1 Tax=Aegilops tauschii subsp. strangulata TaxID=200361 RepID=A0A453DD41_AEGTS